MTNPSWRERFREKFGTDLWSDPDSLAVSMSLKVEEWIASELALERKRVLEEYKRVQFIDLKSIDDGLYATIKLPSMNGSDYELFVKALTKGTDLPNAQSTDTASKVASNRSK